MKMPKSPLIHTIFLIFVSLTVFSQQVSYFNQGFLRQQNAAQDLAWLGLTGFSGSGSVTNFTASGFSPLFTASVTTPTVYPHLSFAGISQSANLFYASPSGSSGVPTFRALVTLDLPDITSIVRGDVSANAPVLYDSSTGIFSMHVADATHDGYLSSTDWNLFHAGGSGTLTGVTNASFGVTGYSLISNSNAPVIALKSISAGAGTTITDNGTNLVLGSTATGGSSTDIPMTNLTTYANGTNFYIDFNWPAQTMLSTGDIAFNFSTNWGLSRTSRVANVFIPATNIFRHVYFLNASTNWHSQVRPIVAVPTGYGATIQFQLYGPGETNVAFVPNIDNAPVGTNWIAAGFNPTNSQGGCVLWLESSQGAAQDEYGTVPVIPEFPVRSWQDLVAGGRLTNNAATSALIAKSPNTSPGNIPAFNWTPTGTAWLASTNFPSDLAQPNWAFIMYYGRGSSLAFLDGLSEGHRFAFIPSESPSVNMTLYSGTSINVVPVGSIAWRLFAVLQNGASSVIRTNGILVTTSNSGSQAPGRWVIGSDYNLGSFTGNSLCSEILIYHTNLTALQVTNVENYFRTKYGAW